MIFTLTTAGIASALAAGDGGPLVKVVAFKVGSAVAYTPVIGDTALRGSILYTGTVSNYVVESANVCSYSVRMDQTVGDFSYGEIGLFLEDGTLFALASLPSVQPKRMSAGANPGNSVEHVCKLAFTNLPGLIDFTILELTEAKLLEISSVDLLDAPIFSIGNGYICHSGDDEGNPILVVRDNDYKWGFSTHRHIQLTGTVDSSGANTTSQVYSVDIGDHIASVQAGRYIVQFLTGAWRGLARNVSLSGNGYIQWVAPLGGAPNVGDTFNIYVSDAYLLTLSSQVEDNLLALLLALTP